jgi:HD-GYP domain-containing protein (c-di-GMP phosphodiesterase class II)
MYKLNIRQVSYALSEALDMVGVDDLYHGKRVAFIASKMCQVLGFSNVRIDRIINIGMLHDCGVSNTDVHIHLVKELDWDGSQNHCDRGAVLVQKVDIYKEYADTILYHHTHWSDLADVALCDDGKIDTNIILLSDRVDALRSQKKSYAEIIDILVGQKSKMFSAQLVDAFIEASKPDSFWFYLEDSNIELFLQEWIAGAEEEMYSYTQLKEIAYMFSNIVDAKSKFTAEHSVNVSKVALFLAKQFQLSQKQIETLELAALLHDLGKLRVDDAILEKHGPLNSEERHIMDRHGFDSEMILRKIDGFKEIACLASTHHETLDGKGYPYQKHEDALSIEARILGLSDIFQALVQNRPYRKQLNILEIVEILHAMRDEGKIDIDVLSMIEEHIDELYKIADAKVN